jgi:ribosomal protein S21
VPGKVEVLEGESFPSLLRRFRQAVECCGGLLVGPDLVQANRRRRRDVYLKPSEKRRQREKVAHLTRLKADNKRRRAQQFLP